MVQKHQFWHLTLRQQAILLDNRLMTPPYLLLVDDHTILLEGLHQLIQSNVDNVDIGVASSLYEALQAEMEPTLILLDFKLPGVDGLNAISACQQKWPQSYIIVLSSQDDMATQRSVLASGVFAFISKSSAFFQVTEVISSALAVPFNQRENVSWQEQDADIAQDLSLTSRQLQILDLLSQGLSNKLIARELSISPNTVRRHIQDIFTFFKASTRTEALFTARQQGIIP